MSQVQVLPGAHCRGRRRPLGAPRAPTLGRGRQRTPALGDGGLRLIDGRSGSAPRGGRHLVGFEVHQLWGEASEVGGLGFALLGTVCGRCQAFGLGLRLQAVPSVARAFGSRECGGEKRGRASRRRCSLTHRWGGWPAGVLVARWWEGREEEYVVSRRWLPHLRNPQSPKRRTLRER